MFWKLWLAVLIVSWLYILWTRRRFYLLTLKIPGPQGYPILGMIPKLINREDVLRVFGYHLDKQGPTLFSWLGPIPFLVTSEPQVIQDIFTSPHCVSKGINYKSVEDAIGKSLMSLSDPLWSLHRKLLNPAFGQKAVISFLPIFNKESKDIVDIMDMFVDHGTKDLLLILQKSTMSIAAQTTMGNDLKAVGSVDGNQVVKDYQCLMENIVELTCAPWLRIKWIRQLLGKENCYGSAKERVRGFIRKMIRIKLDRPTKNGPVVAQTSLEKYTFIDIAIDLLSLGTFTKKNIESESTFILLAAFETTATTLANIIILLSMFPKYQEKAFEEILSLFPHKGDFEVTYAETKEMVYLDLIINETMRLMPSIPIVSREVTEDLRLSNGIIVPKGVQINIDIFHLHRNEKIWGEGAKTFNPDHFLPQHFEKMHPYAFIPFTKGIRNCIGKKYAMVSMKVTLAKLIRNFKFSTSFKFEDLHFVEGLSLKLKTVPLIEVQRRA